jgi:Ca2+-transporting ATPase
MFFLLLGVGCWLMEVHPIFIAIQYSLSPDETQTVFFTVFVLLQWWNLFNARTMGSSHSAFYRLWDCKGFLLVLFLILAGQWLIVTLGGQMFRTVPLSLECWLYMFLATSPVLLFGELYRATKRV